LTETLRRDSLISNTRTDASRQPVITCSRGSEGSSYDRFTEGFETVDLRAAKALAKEVA
jgi:hypothetical protein